MLLQQAQSGRVTVGSSMEQFNLQALVEFGFEV